MAQFQGFLVRNSLTDTGSVPRIGAWSASPDIIPAGMTAQNPTDLIKQYNTFISYELQEGVNNYLYVRAKNTSSQPLQQNVYLFQVPQHLFLAPNVWYSDSNLVHFAVVDQSGNITYQNYQTISANPSQVVATNGFTWKPQSSEHHCLVAVIASDFDAVQHQFPPNVTIDVSAYAAWIYQHGNIGWHNVNIKPYTSDLYEQTDPIVYPFQDAQVTFTMVGKNVPVNAVMGFSANTQTSYGDVIAVGDTIVPQKPGAPDPKINPDFEIGTTVKVQNGYSSSISYYVNFKGQPRPANFSMSVKATVASASPQARTSLRAFAQNYSLVFDEYTLFVHPQTREIEQGVQGYLSSLGGPIIPGFVTTVGSYLTTPSNTLQS